MGVGRALGTESAGAGMGAAYGADSVGAERPSAASRPETAAPANSVASGVPPRGRPRRYADDELLDRLAAALVAAPTASLAELAARAGVSRTTVHRSLATRLEVLRAVAWQSIERVRPLHTAPALENAFSPDVDDAASWAAVHDFVEALVPYSPRLRVLLQSPELQDDAELGAAVAALDPPLLALFARARDRGAIAVDVSPRWALDTLDAVIWVAWEHLAAGALASHDVADRVLGTWRRGIGA